TYSIGPMWVDQYPVTSTCPTCGIFYTTEGVAPNRIFDIEFRNAYYPGNATPNLNYEVRLFEGQTRFDAVYGSITSHTGGTDSALTVGVQKNTTVFTEVGCDATGTNPPPGVVTGAVFTYNYGITCPSPTPTPATPTPTPTRTP